MKKSWKTGLLAGLILAQGVALLPMAQHSALMQRLMPVSEAALPYQLDTTNHVVTVGPANNPTYAINEAFKYLRARPDKTTRWTMRFLGGTYAINSSLNGDNIVNVSFVSDPYKRATLKKSSTFSGEYLWYARYNKNISMSGFSIYGKTPVYSASNYSTSTSRTWMDQGLWLGSTRDVVLTGNRFFDFGNAAIRVNTDRNDPVPGVNSFNTTIKGGYFRNCYQITTTSDNTTTRGGTNGLVFQDNLLDDLRGSIKFCSRTNGAKNVKVINNRINSASRDAYEICSYNNIEFTGNLMNNVKNFAINAYTNGAASTGFNWGDDMVFRGNTITNAYKGIRFGFDPYRDGYKVVAHRFVLENNRFDNITYGSMPLLFLTRGPVVGASIKGNVMSRIANGTMFSFYRGSSGITVSNNTLNGAPYNKYVFN